MRQQFEAFLCMLDPDVIVPKIHLDEVVVEIYNSTVVKYIPTGRLWKLYNPGTLSFIDVVEKVLNKSCRSNNEEESHTKKTHVEFVVLNQGLHHNAEEKVTNKESTTGLRAQALAASTAYSLAQLRNSPKNGINQKVFWRETTQQHFATPDGNFDGKCRGQDCQSCIVTPLERNSSIRNTSNFRNDITNRIIETSGMTVVPIFEPLQYSPYNFHFIGDCTHYNSDGLIFINMMCLTYFYTALPEFGYEQVKGQDKFVSDRD